MRPALCAGSKQDAVLAVALCAVTLLVYSPVLANGFIFFDDPGYVGNPYVLRGPTPAGLHWAFTVFLLGNWIPLTLLSHMLDARVFGAWAGGHHLTSVLLHAANTVLLFLALRRLTGARWPSVAVAALFALHPLHVESVAWVAERKDVLCAFFWMLTLLAYVRYAERPGTGRFLPVAAGFVAALMAKPMAISLPFVLLLLDAWPLGRWQPFERTSHHGASFPRIAFEKTPLFLIAAASSVVTILAQRSDEALRSWDQYRVGLRIANALVSYVRYLGKTVWPADLILFYPFVPIPAWQAIGAGALLAALCVLAALAARRRPHLLVGWLWYLGTLVPVIGLVQVGGQALADRYTYLPHVGLFVAAVWGGSELLRGPRSRRLVAAATGIALATLAAATVVQLGYWRDSTVMSRRILAVDPANYRALNTLGALLAQDGDVQGGSTFLSQSFRNNPTLLGEVHIRTGNQLLAAGKREQALQHFRRAAQLDPFSPAAGQALREALAPEVKEIRARFRPMIASGGATAVEGLYRQGVCLGWEGLHEEALESFAEAVRTDPGNAKAHFALGFTYTNLKRYREAAAAYETALRIKPDLAEAKQALERLRPLM